jgi:hypothetical protein
MLRPGKKMAVSFAAPVTSKVGAGVVPLYEKGVTPCQYAKLHSLAAASFKTTDEPWSCHWLAVPTAPPAGVLAPTSTKNWCVYWASRWKGPATIMTLVTFESHRSPCPPGKMSGTVHVEAESIQYVEELSSGGSRTVCEEV